MRLDSFISELLYHHNCVIVDGFGGFVASHKGAFINPVQHTFSPPSKRIAFNSSLRTNDGLLASYLCTKENISYSDACAAINKTVEEYFSVLDSNEKLTLENIGIVYYDQEKNIQFVPDPSSNYLLDSFGLTAVHSPSIRREQAVHKMATHYPGKNSRSKKRIQRWRIIEVIPAAAILVLVFLTPVAKITDRINWSTINPFSYSSQEVNILSIDAVKTDDVTKPAAAAPAKNDNTVALNPGSDLQNYTYGAEQETSKPSPSENIFAKPDTEVPTPADEPEFRSSVSDQPENVIPENKEPVKAVDISPSSPKAFYIIAGCFKIEENAEKLYADLVSKGYHAQIIGKHKGLTAVCYESFSSEPEAKSALARIKAEHNNAAWMLVK